ncbi:MAG: NAD+ synthase [bacterium]
MTQLHLALAQINPLVGDIEGNTNLIVRQIQLARDELGADLLLCPELVVTGYPPEDLLLRPSIEQRVSKALDVIAAESKGIAVVVGYPGVRVGAMKNLAGVFADGQKVAEYAKQCLPNYQVFDEKRYFRTGDESAVFEHKGVKFGLTVCEDIWHEQPVKQAVGNGAQVILNLNASPFHRGKQQERLGVLRQRAKENAVPIVYVNMVGGQDELVFDGGSMVVSAAGELTFQAPMFETDVYSSILDISATPEPVIGDIEPELPLIPSVYQALVMGVRDYVNKNRFKGVVLGLSGGIDSALTLAVAVDALGAERVEAVMMPFKYTSQMSKDDAAEEARLLGVPYQSISIEKIYSAFTDALAGEFEGLEADKTEENIQARSRGVLLMAISNKKGYLVLTTGNKSEMAVGYATLYGDMAGGFDVLKDVPKTMVFELCRYRNTLSPVIPESVITRPPSAELAPDQVDEDSLPPYPVLDQILALYIEEDLSADAIVAQGFDRDDVYHVLRMVDINEYKRRQAPIGVRITKRGFGRDRRYPVTNGWKLGE